MSNCPVKRVLLMFLCFLFVSTTALSQHLVHVGDSEEAADQSIDITSSQVAVDDSKPFIATSEWQVIQPGQKVPKGLHVRINLQTGLKEAKLLDPSEEDADQVTGDSENTKRFNPALEEALKNIATSRDEPSGNKEKATTEKVTQQFRSIDEIKSEFSKRKVTISSEQEILTELYKELNEEPDVNSLIHILNDVEFYLHNVDSAQYFSDIGGIKYLVRMLNTSTTDELLALLAHTIGSASQNNAYVSKHLHENGAVSVLLKHIQTSCKDLMAKRTVFALSSILRAYPTSFSSFMSNGGLETFSLLVMKSEVPVKVKVKVYTLLSDLLHDNQKYSDIYNLLTSQLTSAKNLCSELRVIIDDDIDNDSLEKLLTFIIVSSDTFCPDLPISLSDTLTNIQVRLSKDTGELDDYYSQLIDLISTAKTSINNVTKRDEL